MLAALEDARELAREAYRIFSDRGARLLAASIAFYALLSVVPILVIALRVAGLFVGPTELDSTLRAQLLSWVGAEGGETLLSLVSSTRAPSHSSLTSLAGLIVLVYGATRLFSQLTRALDLLWNTEPPARPEGWLARGLLQLRKRALAFAMVLGVGVLLILLVLLHTALAAARHAVAADVSLGLRLVEVVGSFALTTLLFFMVFRVLPRTPVTSRDALVGGAVTAVLFTVGSLLVTAYLTYRDLSVYGTAGAIVMLMLWAHYSAHAFFLGAAFTRAHSLRRSSPP